MDSFDKPPPYSPPACGTPIPVGYPTVTTEPQPLYYNGMPSYGTVTDPAHSIAIGVCPACRAGILKGSYPCSAILLALFCIPCCGICCCLAMKHQRCTNCRALFQ